MYIYHSLKRETVNISLHKRTKIMKLENKKTFYLSINKINV